MGARLIPAEPVFVNIAEREVWERLGDHDVLLANQRLTDHEQDHEADLVVLMPDVGIKVVEVKGGGIEADQQGPLVAVRRRLAADQPVRQARKNKHALREYVQREARWRDSSPILLGGLGPQLPGRGPERDRGASQREHRRGSSARWDASCASRSRNVETMTISWPAPAARRTGPSASSALTRQRSHLLAADGSVLPRSST